MADITLSSLHRADGSATYSGHGYTVLAAVNGPIEVQRRDELPEEAAVDVAVRPAAGAGGIRERHLESIVQNTLHHVILGAAHPRTLIQITLQVTKSQENGSVVGALSQAGSNLSVLPALLQASILALLSTSIPLLMTYTATMIAVSPRNELMFDASAQDLRLASSIHVLAFSSKGDLLVIESEGDFSMDIWEEVHGKAKAICQGREEGGSDSEDTSMDLEESVILEDTLKDAVRSKIQKEMRWKNDST